MIVRNLPIDYILPLLFPITGGSSHQSSAKKQKPPFTVHTCGLLLEY